MNSSKAAPVGALLRDDAALGDFLLRRHGEVLAAESRIQQARADAGASRLIPNPGLDTSLGGVTLGATNPHGLGFGDTGNFNVGITQTIELGKRGPRMEAADLRLQEAKKSWAFTLSDKVADARVALARVVYLKARLRLVEEGLASAKRAEELERARLDHGGISGNDYDRLMLDTLVLETDVARNRSEYAGALAACEGAIYAPCDPGSADVADLDAAAPLPPALPAPAESAAHRPDVEAARLESAAAEQDAVLARRRAIPDPSIRVGYTHDNAQLGGAQPNTLNFSVSIPLPIFDHGQHDAAKALARAAEQRHVAETLEMGATSSYGALIDRKTFLEATMKTLGGVAVPKSAGVLDATSKAFDQGQVSMTDLLLARRTHLALILNQIDVRFDYFSVRNDLRRVLGLDAAGGDDRHSAPAR